MKVVIMAGGSGSRLWPLSRELYPKQFLHLTNNSSTMFQLTVERAYAISDEAPIVICNEEHRFIVAEQLRQIGRKAEIILEPIGRNTAPAICLAALMSQADCVDPVIMVLAADHDIKSFDSFSSSVSSAMFLAEAGHLVTFGIVPSQPETGYGYIQRGDQFNDSAGFYVRRFVEKPDRATADSYLKSGEYYWNSGMFMFRASVYLNELAEFSPEILDVCKLASKDIVRDLDFLRISADEFTKCPDDSIDYAVMEKTNLATVVPMDAGWSDVGSWSSMWEVNQKDENGNVVHGDVLLHDTHSSLIHASSKLVCAVGIDDAVVVETKDAILIASREKAQDVKSIVSMIKSAGRNEHRLHREVYRPWGVYDSIDEGDRYQVKRITVKPGEKLSLQMHYHRAEHWVVVSGTAMVRRGESEEMLSENESIYIPIGVTHSLENPGKIPLELIEVQSGSYLGEDDIVRFEDRYGRS